MIPVALQERPRYPLFYLEISLKFAEMELQARAAGRGATQRVLVIFPGALGDLICLAPALSALARQHPGAGLELMAREELARFAQGRLGVARAHAIDRREVPMLFRPGDGDIGPAREFFGAFDRIYSFFAGGDPGFRRALAEAACGTPVTFHRFRPAGAGHVAAHYLREVGAKAEPMAARVEVLPSDLESARRALDGVGEAAGFVALFPGSGSAAKNWPAERFVALSQELRGKYRTLFVLGPAEEGLSERFGRAGHPVLRELPLGTVAALARLGRAFVGADSGVSHLAAAAGCPGVVLFGPSAPERWRPLGRVIILRREPLAAIEPGEATAALAKLIEGGAESPLLPAGASR